MIERRREGSGEEIETIVALSLRRALVNLIWTPFPALMTSAFVFFFLYPSDLDYHE